MMQHLKSEVRKTYFSYIPKSGVESLILLVMREDGNMSKDIWRYNPQYHCVDHVPVDYEYICICRNPYNRLVSGFIDKFLTGNFNLLPFCNEVMSFYNRTLDDERRVSFSEFIEYLILQDPEKIDPHFSLQISSVDVLRKPEIYKLEEIESINLKLKYLGFKNSFENYRKIYLYEWQKENISDAHNLYFKDYDIFLTKNVDGNHGIMPHYDNFYNDELKEKIYEFYKKDFEFFGYEK